MQIPFFMLCISVRSRVYNKTLCLIILILTYQAYHKTAPQSLCDLIIPYSNARNLTSDNMLLIAPCHTRAKLKFYGERLFQYVAPTEWNKLPLLIRESPSLDIFKTQLITFLFKSTLES